MGVAINFCQKIKKPSKVYVVYLLMKGSFCTLNDMNTQSNFLVCS